MRLRQMLKENGRVLQINQIEDFQKLQNAEHDYLVEIKGQVFRSPLSEALEAVFRIIDMLGVDVLGTKSPHTQPTGGKKRGKGQQRTASELDKLARLMFEKSALGYEYDISDYRPAG